MARFCFWFLLNPWDFQGGVRNNFEMYLPFLILHKLYIKFEEQLF